MENWGSCLDVDSIQAGVSFQLALSFPEESNEMSWGEAHTSDDADDTGNSDI